MLRGDEAKCQLVSSAFSWLVQFCLGVAAFSTLVVKGFTERPRRRFCVWCVDVLKQGSSGCMNHFLNIGIALWLTGGESDEDECAWYFVNFAINTVIGGAVSWALLRLVELAAGSTKWPCCRGRAACIALAVSGEYGQNGDAAIASALGQQVETEEAAPRAPNIMDLPMMNVVAPQGKVSSLLEFCTPRPTRERAGICIRALRFPH